ncbi:palmitoyltransferase ZDHHC22-like [Physella acuta]|uniref:palmitoyltransferase ZDHHC22-like n=1 Tax=Physella acuta TaxID=109671 RepID=UPI0027DE8E6C|nr:palmitoyltransferase ZDHHC22-like [Physella acuta]
MAKTDPNRSLKEKLQDHYNSRNFQAKDSTITRFAVSFVWVNTLTLVLEGLLVLIPSHHLVQDGRACSNSSCTSYRCAQAVTLWLFAQTAWHWFCLRDGSRNVVTRGVSGSHKHVVKTDWKWCSRCNQDAPPRSHHCTLCEHCVLRRDHHCYFSGSCVGHYNQRHFVLFLLYVICACSYAVYMQSSYLSKQENLTYFIPLVAMWKTVTGQAPKLYFCILVHMYLSTVSLFASVGFISCQTYIILKGQTSYEASRGITLYQKRTVYDNFKTVFGTPLQFVLTLFLPVRPHLADD